LVENRQNRDFEEKIHNNFGNELYSFAGGFPVVNMDWAYTNKASFSKSRSALADYIRDM